MVVDGASSHKSKDLVVPENMSLIFLPPIRIIILKIYIRPLWVYDAGSKPFKYDYFSAGWYHVKP
jgi:hypothetical protein